MTFPPIHRVVTGHDADGKAIFTSDGPLPSVVEIAAIPGTIFHEVWSTSGMRIVNRAGSDDDEQALVGAVEDACQFRASATHRLGAGRAKRQLVLDLDWRRHVVEADNVQVVGDSGVGHRSFRDLGSGRADALTQRYDSHAVDTRLMPSKGRRLD